MTHLSLICINISSITLILNNQQKSSPAVYILFANFHGVNMADLKHQCGITECGAEKRYMIAVLYIDTKDVNYPKSNEFEYLLWLNDNNGHFKLMQFNCNLYYK